MMKRWVPATRVMMLFDAAVGCCRRMLASEVVFEGKEISSVRQALVWQVWLDLGLIKEGVGPVLISA